MHGLEQRCLFGIHVKLTMLACLSMIEFDFFLHAGLLASFYVEHLWSL